MVDAAECNDMFLRPVAEVAERICQGQVLSLAGEESLLRQLPPGDWIGGTIPYFMSQSGGQTCKDRLFVQPLPVAPGDVEVRDYGVDELPQVLQDAPEHGCSMIILPASSPVHLAYAQHAPTYPNMFLKPIIGWISGVHLNDLGRIKPMVFNGASGSAFADRAVVLHMAFPPHKLPCIGIVNLFQPSKGDTITFEDEGFEVKNCLINGEPQLFAHYLRSQQVDMRWPLVADYHGAMVNVSFQAVEEDLVRFYAPVFKGIQYRLASPMIDYLNRFREAVPHLQGVTFSCNCILNYLYSSLEGQQTGPLTGPITFGEVAYQLLNQTLVYLTVEEI